MKESQILPPKKEEKEVFLSSPAPKKQIVQRRESIGRITYENRRKPTPPIVYRTERIVVIY